MLPLLLWFDVLFYLVEQSYYHMIICFLVFGFVIFDF